MSGHGRSRTWLSRFAERLPGASAEVRDELSRSLQAGNASLTVGARWLEFSSLLGLSLTLTARLGTGDDRVESVRQGLRIGAIVTAVVLLLQAVVAGESALAVPLGLLLVALGGGFVALARALVVVATIGAVGGGVGMSVLAVVIVLVPAVFLGTPHDGKRCTVGAVSSALGSGVVTLIGLALSPESVEALVIAGALLVVVVLLAVGWFDPRYATAAAFVCVARLLDSGGTLMGLGLVSGSVGDWASSIRALCMLLGVGVSGAIATHSLRWRVGPTH